MPQNPQKMPQNLPILPKKVWSLLRLFYFMLRKGVSKNKLWLDLNLMFKRAKLAGKALQNLLFHHHHHHHWAATEWAEFTLDRRPYVGGEEFEFSCTTSPANSTATTTGHREFSLFSFQNKEKNRVVKTDVDMAGFSAAVMKAVEMIRSETPSPALPGFGRSPVVRQLRVTDSPFPVSGGDEDSHVDEAAEQFINRFYSDLRRQKQISGV